MEILQALILGIVQGLTEFLPISSSAHLILIPKWFGWTGVVDTLEFDIALHIGTTLAVLWFFWKDWVRLISAFLKNLSGGYRKIWADIDSRLLVLLIVGSIPAGIVGLLIEDYIATIFRSEALIAVMLIVFGLVLYAADKFGNKMRKFENLKLGDSILIGLAQTLALVPGVSRSGITITAGLFKGLDREAATRFSFLLSTPIIVAASVFSLKDIASASSSGKLGVFVVGFLASSISGFLAIRFLLRYVQSNNFNIFVIYRIVVGGLILLTLLIS